MQVKMLRVLQERQYEPLGSHESVKTDARIITATNRDIEALVKEGKFRQDLYYRIHIMQLPFPLRERREDIPLLADQFLQKFAVLNKKPIVGFSSEVYACFYAYNWPGNVRELENVVERAVVLSNTDLIVMDDLPTEIACSFTKEEVQKNSDMYKAKEQLEKRCILEALEKHSYKITKVAKELKIHRSTLYRKINYHEIELK